MEIKTLVVGPISTNCYLISSGKELAIIDPGANSKKILKEIENLGFKVKYIILTHSHLDHISAAQEMKRETGAKILAHEIERYSLNFPVDISLKEGDEIKIGKEILKVLHTPGHTPGSICLLSKDFVFTGDTLFKEGVGRTDLPGGSQIQLEKSLQKLSRFLKPGMKIYPGHGEIFEYSNNY
jgi:glyoxylase-like metal-dependent hydrolase (beta-lactamase superfamily II)